MFRYLKIKGMHSRRDIQELILWQRGEMLRLDVQLGKVNVC